MAVIAGLTNSFKKELLEGVHDLSLDTMKIALYTNEADLTPATTVYSDTKEVTDSEEDSDYVAGGATLTNNGLVQSGPTVYIDFGNVEWDPVTFTTRGALIYNSSKSNKSIAVIDFSLDRSVSNGKFTVNFPEASVDDAIIRIE